MVQTSVRSGVATRQWVDRRQGKEVTEHIQPSYPERKRQCSVAWLRFSMCLLAVIPALCHVVMRQERWHWRGSC